MLFKKKKEEKQDNQQTIADVGKELLTHGMRGGAEGIATATNNLMFREIFNWAQRHKKRGENITREVLIAKMKTVIYSNKAWEMYAKTLGYNEKTINQLADDVMSAL